MTPEQAHTKYREFIAQELLLDHDIMGRNTYKTHEIIAALDRADYKLDAELAKEYAAR